MLEKYSKTDHMLLDYYNTIILQSIEKCDVPSIMQIAAIESLHLVETIFYFGQEIQKTIRRKA